MARLWTQTIQRILLRARAYAHGGAFLLAAKPSMAHLRVNHRVKYHRVASLLALAASSWFVRQNVYDSVQHEFIETGSDAIPVDRYYDESIAAADNRDADRALSDAVGFVALLSRVDGLVLMDHDLRVLGFGAEITAPDTDVKVVTARTGRSTTGRQLALERFGTRHRSMFRYCAAHPGSVGFVISADGPVRAVLRHRDRVLMWDNVRLRPSGIDEVA